MNTTIWKYNLQPLTSLRLPQGAKILCVQAQYDEINMWVHVDLDQPLEDLRHFSVYDTGRTIKKTGTYLGTVQLHQGALVLHVFEESGE
jgi:hypothetical protein